MHAASVLCSVLSCVREYFMLGVFWLPCPDYPVWQIKSSLPATDC